MSAPHFADVQKIVGARVIEVEGNLEITEEYQPVELMVGVVQVEEKPGSQGRRDFDLKAGAYGVGVPPATKPLADGEKTRDEKWSMYLQLDSDETKRNFEVGLAYGFVLVKQTGGGCTGWIDEIQLEEAEPVASEEEEPVASSGP